MTASLPLACLEAGLLAAFLAQIGHARCRDPEAARACGWVSACLLCVGAGFLILWWGSAAPPSGRDAAARTLRTAPVSRHAPSSWPAPARDPAHRPVTLLAGSGR